MADFDPNNQPQPELKRRTYWYFFPGNWKFFAVFTLPAILAWICFFPGQEYIATIYPNGTISNATGKEFYSVYVIGLTGLYWTFDCMPLASAGFIPLIMYPLFLVEEAKKMASKYMQDVGMMTFTCCILALGAITSGLSKRIANKILCLVSSDLRRIMFVCMLITVLFSMWFVNTAVMIFMMDVVDELKNELSSGAGIGTLGDAKMNEWNSINSNEIIKVEEKVPIENQDEPTQNEPTIDSNVAIIVTPPTPTKDAKQKVTEEPAAPISKPETPLVATSSTDSLEELANSLGDTEEEPDENLSEAAIAAKKSKTSLLSSDSMYIEPTAAVETPVSEKQILLKIQNDEFLESYKINLLQAIAIAANIGGLLWPYTNTSNIAFPFYHGMKEFMYSKFFNQAQWLNFTYPIILISFPFALWWMDFLNFVLPEMLKKYSTEPTLLEATSATLETKRNVQNAFQEKYKTRGNFNSHEIGILIVITTTVALFVFRKPEFFAGLAALFEFVKIKDSTIGALAVLIGFIFPKCGTDMFRGPKSPGDKASFTAILDWKSVQQKFPWGLLIFIGAGTAIAHGCIKSDFNKDIVTGLDYMFKTKPPQDPWLVLLVSIILTNLLANFLTSTAAAHIAAHIFMTLSDKLKLGPCYLSVPCVVACSFAMVLPAGTPPMAMVHMKTHKISGFQRSLRGLPITIFGVALVYGFGLFYTDLLMTCGN